MAAIALVALIAGCANAPAEAGGGGGEKPATQGSTVPEPNATGETTAAQQPQKYRPEFSKCVRENGVEDFPDPNADGIILYYGDDPDLPAASEKCDHLLPGGRPRQPGNGG
jgi:hypothetical protein